MTVDVYYHIHMQGEERFVFMKQMWLKGRRGSQIQGSVL